MPALGAMVLIRRAAPLDPVWTALLGLVAAGAAGALTSELACPIRVPMHVMLWHVLPIAVYAALGTAAVWLVVKLRRASEPSRCRPDAPRRSENVAFLRSVGQAMRRPAAPVAGQQARQPADADRPMTAIAVGGADRERQRPLRHQRPPGGDERARRDRRCASPRT